ncbi:quinone oxidoreductase [Pusillimonas sp. MFBS29]|uniref:quinone oxidoreductase family protein n=1 Tax=Pusillimonas sp. MFBS29 TaxID=2886690 RepID=UPI001D12094F|nr:quinone oxidoreductase [Pusillimonas sp. MFBS29]MCC2597127.1 quinone oxidoreductase [Pusillimonas sp. MFBS29]
MHTAIVLREAGRPEQLNLESINVPEPSPGEVQVRHEAIGVNFHDVYVRSGLYKTLPLPGIPGLEAAGVVTATGAGVEHFREGDRVAYFTSLYGGYASGRVISQEQLIPLPEAISFELAASHLLKGLTSYALAHEVYTVKPGDTVLVHAAAGGVGSLLCQWAAAAGATVIGTVGSAEKAESARRYGCSHIVLYREKDFVPRVQEITDSKGVQVAYDSVGKDTFAGSLACLAPSGHLANFGQSSGPIPPFEISQLFPKSNSVSRLNVFVHFRDIARRRQAAQALFTAFQDGTLQPSPIQRFALSEAAQAHHSLESRDRQHALVLVP